MGNTSSSSSKHTDDTVDFGYLSPQGVYTGPKDWNQAIVTQLVCARRLAPFYRPLEDYEESWTEDQILAARKELPDPEQTPGNDTVTRVETGNSTHSNKSSQPRKTNVPKESGKPEAGIYKGAVECPICFLYYPPNINHSRCCDQAICTECFVQIKRNEPTPTHLVSEPAACPYCVQENFGIIYKPPSWRAGVGSEGFDGRGEGAPQYATHKRRNKNVGHDAPEVVTTDIIRPDWEAKLAAVQAAVARRANRRIIMRQVGDRLIPVGVTSGRVHAINPEDAQAEGEGGSGSSRRRRRQQQQQQAGQTLDQFLGSMGMAGPDLEELMVMEAMRLSLVEHEAQQKKEAEEKKKKEAATATSDATDAGSSSQAPPPSDQGDSTSPQGSSPSASSSTRPQDNKGGSSLSSLRDRWQSARTSPPPFSTMRAALSAASTAGAVLAKSPDSERSPPLERAADPNSEANATSTSANVAVGSTSDAAEPRVDADLPVPSTSPTGPENPHASTSTGGSVPAPSSISQASSIGSETSGPPTIDPLSYTTLASSPESVVTLSGDQALLAPSTDNPIDAAQHSSEGQRLEEHGLPSTRC